MGIGACLVFGKITTYNFTQCKQKLIKKIVAQSIIYKYFL